MATVARITLNLNIEVLGGAWGGSQWAGDDGVTGLETRAVFVRFLHPYHQ